MKKETERPAVDRVSAPPHYRQGGIECVAAVKAAMTPEEYVGWLKGNTFKYLWRMNHKGTKAQDAAKAAWYLARLNEAMAEEQRLWQEVQAAADTATAKLRRKPNHRARAKGAGQ